MFFDEVFGLQKQDIFKKVVATGYFLSKSAYVL